MRASYTIIRRPNRTIDFYRGALRIERETVIWECSHEHFGGPRHTGNDSAIVCARQELARRGDLDLEQMER